MLQDAVPSGKFNWPHTHTDSFNMWQECGGGGSSANARQQHQLHVRELQVDSSSHFCLLGSHSPIAILSSRLPPPSSHPLLLPCFLLLKCCFMSPGKQLDMKLSLFSVCVCVRQTTAHVCVCECVCMCIWCVHKIFLNWSLQHKSNKIKSFLPGDKWQSHRRSRRGTGGGSRKAEGGTQRTKGRSM